MWTGARCPLRTSRVNRARWSLFLQPLSVREGVAGSHRRHRQRGQGQGVGVIVINSNDPDQLIPRTAHGDAEAGRSLGFTFPYVVDATSDVARAFGATRTPEAFLFDKDGNSCTTARLMIRRTPIRSRTTSCKTPSTRRPPGKACPRGNQVRRLRHQVPRQDLSGIADAVSRTALGRSALAKVSGRRSPPDLFVAAGSLASSSCNS